MLSGTSLTLFPAAFYSNPRYPFDGGGCPPKQPCHQGPARQGVVTRFLPGETPAPLSLKWSGQAVARKSDETQRSPPRQLSRRRARGVVYAALVSRGTPGMALTLRLPGQDRRSEERHKKNGWV